MNIFSKEKLVTRILHLNFSYKVKGSVIIRFIHKSQVEKLIKKVKMISVFNIKIRGGVFRIFFPELS